MAFQKGIIKFKGAIGDLTFYKTKNNGFQVREKGGVDASRIATDPKFQRTRENNAEFGRAQKATKLFKTVFTSVIVKGADSTMHNRLTKAMLQVVKNDSINDRGMRMVLDSEVELLQPFEFNAGGQVASTVLLPVRGNIDRASGNLTVSVPGFIPRDSIIAPEGATHFKFKAAGAMIDFETEDSELVVHEAEAIPFDTTLLEASVIECILPPALTKPLFLTFGIDFYQRVNGKDYALNSVGRNGLCLIQVSGM